MVPYTEYLDVAKDIAETAGNHLMNHFEDKSILEVDVKNRNDFVTRLDRESEQMIIAQLREAFPGHGIFAEESGAHHREADMRWVIDPLDGTANYMHGIPFFAVALALEAAGEMVVAVVRDPVRQETFHATKGGGAFRDENRIHVSKTTDLADAFLATGFPFKSHQYIDPYMNCFKELFLNCRAIRRTGSASMDFSYVACGKYDGFWEIGISPWDIAPGDLLIREAGGVIADFDRQPEHIWNGRVVAGTPGVFEQLQPRVRGSFVGWY